MTELELLAPARDALTAIEAVKHGADAVYIGSASHGARATASNSVDDIKTFVDYAHQYNVKVYVTINTLVYESEINDVISLIRQLYVIGVDAIIIQDLGILEMDIPPIALHASTQCDIRTPEKAEFLAAAGFSQLVLPRELSLTEIREIRKVTGDLPLEAFVHGALCVSYSGDCQASLLTTGRSANRGECSQICRLPFNLIDGDGNTVVANKHLLSLKDLNRLSSLNEMANAGISSFKIEGRLKDINYIKETVTSYRQAIDKIIAEHPEVYRQESTGRCYTNFLPDVNKAFNRGFTDYFLKGRPQGSITMATLDSPKVIGEKVATVSLNATGKRIVVRKHKDINNGDGLGYFDQKGVFCGFRANRIDGETIISASDISIPKGTIIYRNSDNSRKALLSGETSTRKIGINVSLSSCRSGLVIEASDERGCHVSLLLEGEFGPARTNQAERHDKELRKTGDTIYEVISVSDNVPDLFIPASVLGSLRRMMIESLNRNARVIYRYDYRRDDNALSFSKQTLDYHDNVANSLSGKFYQKHGVTAKESALETQKEHKGEFCVMTTRYCIRRELDACLKTPKGSTLKGPLTLKSKERTFNLAFDCQNCQMKVLLSTNE